MTGLNCLSWLESSPTATFQTTTTAYRIIRKTRKSRKLLSPFSTNSSQIKLSFGVRIKGAAVGITLETKKAISRGIRKNICGQARCLKTPNNERLSHQYLRQRRRRRLRGGHTRPSLLFGVRSDAGGSSRRGTARQSGVVGSGARFRQTDP